MSTRTGKHWTHCDKCEQPNPNWEWTNYCPACRAGWYKQFNPEGFWEPEDRVEKAWREGADLPGPDDFGDDR